MIREVRADCARRKHQGNPYVGFTVGISSPNPKNIFFPPEWCTRGRNKGFYDLSLTLPARHNIRVQQQLITCIIRVNNILTHLSPY